MQTVARVADELRESAVANLAIGDVGLLVAAFRTDSPGRAVVLFAIVNLVLAVVWGRVGPSGRLRSAAPRAGDPPPGAVVAALSATRRRVFVGLLPVAALIAILVAIAPESAAVIAGVPGGVGAAELWVLGWLRRYERDRHDELLRAAPSSPFSGGRRELYTRPMKDVTDPT